MSVIAQMSSAPKRYDFIQVIRILRRSRMQGELSFAVEALPYNSQCEVQSINQSSQGVKVTLALEALAGAKSVLPDYFHEHLLACLHTENNALLDFLNIFNHRYYQLYSAGIERNNLLLREEQESSEGRELTRYSQRKALSAFGALNDTDQYLSGLLPYSILIGQKSKNLTGLKQILCSYFALQIEVKVVLKTHHLLPKSSLSQLSAKHTANNGIGKGMCLGKSCQLQSKSMEVRVLPKSRAQYLLTAADKDFSGALRRTIELYMREYNPLRVFFYVKREFLAEPQLSSNRDCAVRLGESNCLAPGRKPQVLQQMLIQG